MGAAGGGGLPGQGTGGSRPEQRTSCDEIGIWARTRSPISWSFSRSTGIKVVLLKLDLGVSGATASVHRPGHDPVPAVLVNESMAVERQRFTLAHELGHLLLSIREGLDEEKVANRFAGAFLLPALSLLAELGKGRDRISMGELLAMKVLYKVSFLAMVHRCGSAGVISSSEAKRWFIIAGQRGWRRPPYPEPDPLPKEATERPKRFRRLCLRAVAAGLLSEPKAAELLNTTVLKLQKLLEPPELVFA